MQIPSGSRGALAYLVVDLDIGIYLAGLLNDSARAALPDRSDLEFYITFAGFNLKDSIRDKENVALLFAYKPADCRIYYTARTVYNYHKIWNYIVDALWRNSSLCVKGSTEYVTAASILDDPTKEASEASIADMIMQGFSSRDPNVQKRSLPSTFQAKRRESYPGLASPRLNLRKIDRSRFSLRLYEKLAARGPAIHLAWLI